MLPATGTGKGRLYALEALVKGIHSKDGLLLNIPVLCPRYKSSPCSEGDMDETTTFYFTEFEVISAPSPKDTQIDHSEQIRNSIINYMNSDEPIVVSDSDDWRFGDIEVEDQYVVGQFGKIFEKERTTFDEEKGVFVDNAEPTFEAEYSKFILHFDRGLLIYHTTDRVRHEAFRRNFAEGYEKSKFGDFDLDISFIYNKIDAQAIINNFPVKEASFQIEPSNPHSDPDWEQLDQSVKKMLAQKLDIDVESLEGKSLNFEEEFLSTVFEMSKSDYGEYELIYDDNGELKSISKDGEPVKKEEEPQPGTLDELKAMASGLISFASSFL